ncbi:MAG: hypothetical protein ACOYU2_06055 [Nitrospirota bacterium]
MTKYDYLNGKKKILTSDGKKADITLLKGFNQSHVLIELGRKGYLKGEALTDYEKIANNER